MELIAGGVGTFHRGSAHLDAFLVAAGVERALTFRPDFVVVAPINDHAARRSVSGRPGDVTEQPVPDLDLFDMPGG
jgi:hypothetical protein